MKRLISVILSAMILISLAAAAPSALAVVIADSSVSASSGTTGDCTWSFDSSTGNMTITGTGDGRMGYYPDDTQLPWYSLRSKIKTITFGKGVTTVTKGAFAKCTELTTVKFVGSVQTIAESAFEYCSKLSAANLNPPLKTIGSYAFSNTALTSVALPLSVTKASVAAFSDCKSLNSVKVPDGCSASIDGAFRDCEKLTDVYLGSSIKSIGDAFDGCPVSNMTVSSSNPYLTMSGSFLLSKDKTKVHYYLGGDTNFYANIPSTVTEIGESAFSGHDYLTSVNFPSGLKKIGDYAFSNVQISSFSFPDSLESVGYDAFFGTPWLERQPDGMVYAGKVAYKYKGDVPQSVTFKSGTLGIGGGAFENSTTLKSVTFSSTVTNIGKNAFCKCSNLSTMRLPRNIKSIGEKAFYSCTLLPSLVIRSSVTELGNSCFMNCTSLKSLELSESLTSIPTNCFWNCTALEGDIVIPKSVKYVGDYAFMDTNNVNSFTVLNPDLEYEQVFQNSFGYGNKTRVMYGFTGSTAEKYALDNGWLFTAITDVRGDANFDGVVTIRDVTAIQRAVSEYQKLSPQAIANIDMTHNGKADVEDATVIQRYLAEYTAQLQ